MSVASVPTHVLVPRLLQRAALRGSLHLVQFSNWVLYTRKKGYEYRYKSASLSLSLSKIDDSSKLQSYSNRNTINEGKQSPRSSSSSPPLPCPALPCLESSPSFPTLPSVRPSWSCIKAQGIITVFLPSFLSSFLPSLLSSFFPPFLPVSCAIYLLPYYRTSISTARFLLRILPWLSSGIRNEVLGDAMEGKVR